MVRIKVKETGEKVRATVTDIRVETEQIEVTLDGSMGEPPSGHRAFIPGRRSTTITLILDES